MQKQSPTQYDQPNQDKFRAQCDRENLKPTTENFWKENGIVENTIDESKGKNPLSYTRKQ